MTDISGEQIEKESDRVIPVAIKLVGISGTPIKGGNCDTMVQEA